MRSNAEIGLYLQAKQKEYSMMLNKIKKQLQNENKHILGHQYMKKYAVTIPLVRHNQSLSVLFEKRAESLRRQPGDISFPGGKVENQDMNTMDTAIRETSEELGIPISDIEIIHEMDIYVHSQNMIVYPFVSYLSTSSFQPNPKEVDEIFLVPIEYLMNTKPEKYQINLTIEPEEAFPFQHISGGKNYSWRHGYIEEMFYYYEQYVIWGMTARILYHFIDKIKP